MFSLFLCSRINNFYFIVSKLPISRIYLKHLPWKRVWFPSSGPYLIWTQSADIGMGQEHWCSLPILPFSLLFFFTCLGKSYLIAAQIVLTNETYPQHMHNLHFGCGIQFDGTRHHPPLPLFSVTFSSLTRCLFIILNFSALTHSRRVYASWQYSLKISWKNCVRVC